MRLLAELVDDSGARSRGMASILSRRLATESLLESNGSFTFQVEAAHDARSTVGAEVEKFSRDVTSIFFALQIPAIRTENERH